MPRRPDCAIAPSRICRGTPPPVPNEALGASIRQCRFWEMHCRTIAHRKRARHESDAEAARDEIEQHLNIADFKHRLAR